MRGACLALEAPSVESGHCETVQGSHTSSGLCCFRSLPFYFLPIRPGAPQCDSKSARAFGTDYGWTASRLASRSVTERVEADGKVRTE